MAYYGSKDVSLVYCKIDIIIGVDIFENYQLCR